MLAMIMVWIYIFFLSYLYGKVFLDGLADWLYLHHREQEFSLVVLAGLIFITTIGSFFRQEATAVTISSGASSWMK